MAIHPFPCFKGDRDEILEYCDIKDLLERERYYLELLKPEYNILLDPASSKLGFKKFGRIRG
jgi:hypothetical protein